MTGKTSSLKTQDLDPRQAREQTSLECRYGEIGISAVAAAARFSGASKPRADTQTSVIDQRFMESAG